jgi:hypothetical protein
MASSRELITRLALLGQDGSVDDVLVVMGSASAFGVRPRQMATNRQVAMARGECLMSGRPPIAAISETAMVLLATVPAETVAPAVLITA